MKKNKIMKKTYLSPTLIIDAVEEEYTLMKTSFNEVLDDHNSISADEILSREDGSSVWEDED
jgi:hypothetical protein